MEVKLHPEASGRPGLIWAFVTFHTTLFLTFVVLLLYRGGNLAGLLGSLNTLVGLGLFVALWLTTSYTTREAWRRLRWDGVRVPNYARMIGLGVIWGGFNGVLILGVLVLLFITGLAASVVQSQAGRPFGEALSDVAAVPIFALCVGTPVAFMVGAVTGLVLALIDTLLIALSGLWGNY